jgi:hypothetical protein
MLEVLKYFNISSDQELFVFVCCSMGFTFLIVLVFSYSDWLSGKIVSLFSFSVPFSQSVTGEQYAMGNKQLYRIRWQVRGADRLAISTLGVSKNLNPFRSNNRRTIQGVSGRNGELFLELDPNVTQLELSFSNLWGRNRIHLQVMVSSNAGTNNAVRSQPQFRNILHKSYLGQAQDVLLQRLSRSLPQRRNLLNNWVSRFTGICTEVRITQMNRLQSIRSSNPLPTNLSVTAQMERYNQLYSQMANSNQIRLSREEFQRIKNSVQ